MSAAGRKPPLLVALVGPTSSGKSALALEAAAVLGGEIVNCDSMQLYRLLEIGTGKPSAAQRKQVPHHLYDLLDPAEHYSAGRYMVEAREICRQISRRDRVPLVVGGTGLYLRALLEGVFEGPERSDQVRSRLARVARHKGFGYLHQLLRRKDPGAAQRIHPRDHIRVIRTLEVYFLTGAPISRLHEKKRPLEGFRILKVGLDLPRQDLYGRIERRVEKSFREGLVFEVESLLDAGFTVRDKGFEALGYRNAAAVVEGRLSLEEAIGRTQVETRRYAKRQLTWFRREGDVHWIGSAGEDPASLRSLLELLGSEHGGE